MVLNYSSGKITVRSSGKILLDEVGFKIEAGGSLALIGETGAGKTTCALSIMGLLSSSLEAKGVRIDFMGEELSPKKMRGLLGKEIVCLPQGGSDCLNPSKKIKYNLFDNLKRSGYKGAAIKAAAIEKLSRAGFENPEEIAEMYPFELSGGMAQRVLIAISLCSDAKLVICDEPTNGLNFEESRLFIEKLNEYFKDAGKLVITHDIKVAGACGDIAVLLGGRVMEAGKSEKVISAPRHPYTKSLIAALAENGLNESPVLREQEGDCPYFSRCGYADKRCLGKISEKCADGRKVRCVL